MYVIELKSNSKKTYMKLKYRNHIEQVEIIETATRFDTAAEAQRTIMLLDDKIEKELEPVIIPFKGER